MLQIILQIIHVFRLVQNFCMEKPGSNSGLYTSFYAPMIYTAPCVMFLMRADTLRGQVGGGCGLNELEQDNTAIL